MTSSGTSELFGTSFLTALKVVRGSVTLQLGHRSALLSSLVRIGGNLTIEPNGADNEPILERFMLSALTTVDGDATFRESEIGTGVLPVLANVRGTLRFQGGSGAALASTSLRARRLQVEGITGDVLPLPSAPLSRIQVGPMRIVNNPDLCESVVQWFVASQRANGFAGTVTTSGNKTDC